MTREINLRFITPLFSHGATDAPEIRPASIRGQFHFWFRMLGGNIEQERRIFGGIKQTNASSQLMPNHNETIASKVVVRVTSMRTGTPKELPTLPHKKTNAPRMAFIAGASCRVIISDRLGGLTSEDENALNRAIDAWLLMGTLGYRSTRAAGSFTWEDKSFPMPSTPVEYQDKCLEVLRAARSKVAVLGKKYGDAETARRDVSDSLSVEEYNYPLGKIKNGRKTSPLRYRIVKFDKSYQIVAFWDGRKEVTGNSEADFQGVVKLLKQRKPEQIGKQLAEAFNL